MAIKFLNYTPKKQPKPIEEKMAAKGSTQPKKLTPSKIKKEQQRIEYLERREQKKKDFFAKRRVVELEMYEELKGRNIPETVEKAIDGRTMPAQEIIQLWEEYWGEPLGPRSRKYVVANLFAHLIVNARPETAKRYTSEVADFIMERVMEGESLRNICRDPYLPSMSRFLFWCQEYPDLQERYTLAQQIRAETYVDDLIPLADKVKLGIVTTYKADGTVEHTVSDMLNRARLGIDVRKFTIAKVLNRFRDKNGGGGVTDADDGTHHVVITGGIPDKPLGEEDLSVKMLGDPFESIPEGDIIDPLGISPTSFESKE